ncbi:MAG: hypothetical protein V6Z81_00640 [Parvularculales bacterium]
MGTKASVFLGCLFLLFVLIYFFQVQDDRDDNVLLDAMFWHTATVVDVEAFLKGGMNVNARDEDGERSLHGAAAFN